jgi:hypothetical protein
MQIPQEKTNRNYKDSVFVDLFTLGISFPQMSFIKLAEMTDFVYKTL